MPPLTVAIDARLVTRHMTGDTSYWRGLLSGFAETESDTRLLLYSNAPVPQEIPDTETRQWIHLPGRDRWWSLVQFPLAARRAGADVVHTQYNLSPLAGRHGVTTVHDVSFFVGPQWFRPRDRFLLRTAVPASIRRAARVVTVSETSRHEIETYVPASRGKVRVTPNALGGNIVPGPLDAAHSIVKGLGINGPYLLTVGTRWPRKNMGLAVQAAQLANVPLVVTGKPGWGEQPVGVTATGYVSDMELTALYQCASLYLAPSFHEGFGIPLLEAFACGCPVVCSSGGALPETAGGAAEVIDSFDPTVWARTVQSLLGDSSKLESMRARGRVRLNDFSWAKSAKLTLDVYREAAQ